MGTIQLNISRTQEELPVLIQRVEWGMPQRCENVKTYKYTNFFALFIHIEGLSAPKLFLLLGQEPVLGLRNSHKHTQKQNKKRFKKDRKGYI